MPTGVHSVPASDHEHFDSPPLALRARTWLQQRRLDARLADGADPASDRRARAACPADLPCGASQQLPGRSTESCVTRTRAARIRPQVPVRRAPILDCAEDLQALIPGCATASRWTRAGSRSPRGSSPTVPARYTTTPLSLSATRSGARLALDPLELSGGRLAGRGVARTWGAHATRAAPAQSGRRCARHPHPTLS